MKSPQSLILFLASTARLASGVRTHLQPQLQPPPLVLPIPQRGQQPQQAEPEDLKKALAFVKRFHSPTRVKKYQDFAVTDFFSFQGSAPKARHAFFKAKALAQYHHSLTIRGAFHGKSIHGAELSRSEWREFCYKVNKDNSLKISESAEECAKDGFKKATLKGWGQCDYFAGVSYDMFPSTLKIGEPSVEKIATTKKHPVHNWVVVNHKNNPNKRTWVYVDLWLHALGWPYEMVICASGDSIAEEVVPVHDIDVKMTKGVVA